MLFERVNIMFIITNVNDFPLKLISSNSSSFSVSFPYLVLMSLTFLFQGALYNTGLKNTLCLPFTRQDTKWVSNDKMYD